MESPATIEEPREMHAQVPYFSIRKQLASKALEFCSTRPLLTENDVGRVDIVGMILVPA